MSLFLLPVNIADRPPIIGNSGPSPSDSAKMTQSVVNGAAQGPFGGENRPPRQSVFVISRGKSGPTNCEMGLNRASPAQTGLHNPRCANLGRLPRLAYEGSISHFGVKRDIDCQRHKSEARRVTLRASDFYECYRFWETCRFTVDWFAWELVTCRCEPR